MPPSAAAPSPGGVRPSPRRLLLVHAHPDDESILTAATMADAVARGHRVTLLTATRGEAGEVFPAELTGLADDPAALGAHRAGELAAATALLGVGDVRFLRPGPGTGTGRWVDSGMAGDRAHGSGAPADATGDRDVPFADADLLATGAAVARVVREVRPHVVVTYDERGGYGHPDHVAVHRATTYGLALAAAAAFEPAAGPAWDVPKTYWTAAPRSLVVAGLTAVGAAVDEGLLPGLVAHPDPLTAPWVPDELVTTAVDGTAWRETKASAMAAHRTQLVVVRGADHDVFALTNRIAQPVEPVEHFTLARGRPAPGPDGLEHDLFAGLDD